MNDHGRQPGPEPAPLVGRSDELARLDHVLANARRGHGDALVIRGEPGIGKSALLAAARERAGRMQVLQARGHETETGLLFAGLSDLLGTLLDRLDAIPAPQADAIRGALALGVPVPGDRYAVAAGMLGLVAAASRDRPLLILVDDAQWLDEPSLDCLGYVGRRLDRLPVALLLVERAWETSDLGAASRLRDLPALDVGPLGEIDARALLDVTGPGLTFHLRERVLAAAAGNPLGLLELPRSALTDDDQWSLDPLLPMRAGELVGRTFESRVARISPDGRLALLVVAAAEPIDRPTAAAACARLGLGVGSLDAAEAAGLLDVSDVAIEFRHPLARSAVYHSASPTSRRSAHAALAEVTTGSVEVWHRARAAAGPDAEVAEGLARVASDAMARRAMADAAQAFERSAVLTPTPDLRAARFVAAAETAAATGRPMHALELLDRASDGPLDPGLLTSIELRRVAILMLTGPTAGVLQRATTAADLCREERPLEAAATLADAALAATTSDCRQALVLAERARDVLPAEGTGPAWVHVLAALGWCQALRGMGPRALATLDEARRGMASLDPSAMLPPAVAIAFDTSLVLVDPLGARAMLADRAVVLREAGALQALPYTLGLGVLAGLSGEDWSTLRAEAQEAIALARETGQLPTLGYALAALARLEAIGGQEEASRTAATAAEAIHRQTGLLSVGTFAQYAIGLLELGLGRTDAAVEALRRTEVMVHAAGLEDPAMVPYEPDLIEALARNGQVRAAGQVLERLGPRAAMSCSASAAGAAARCRGLLAGDDEFEDAFAQALAIHAPDGPFERARTLLAFGERLHRARRRQESRERLREAIGLFAMVGAAPWVERATVGLRAAGAVRRPARERDTLSVQETRIARAVARGATNREIAGELVLSPRTVESHLERIYGRLGVRSRVQLAAWVAEGGLGADPAGEDAL